MKGTVKGLPNGIKAVRGMMTLDTIRSPSQRVVDDSLPAVGGLAIVALGIFGIAFTFLPSHLYHTLSKGGSRLSNILIGAGLIVVGSGVYWWMRRRRIPNSLQFTASNIVD